MADLTLERIAELRACHDKVRSFHGTHDLGGLAAAMHEWSRQLQMSSDALLDAAERGLTRDRKAAAFDALAEWAPEGMEAKPRKLGIRIEIPYHEVESHGANLLEAVEAMQQKLTEQTDAK